MKQILIFIFFTIVNVAFSQKNYRYYYTLVDSAEYYNFSECNNRYADSLYKIAFTYFDPFPEDVISALLNEYKINSKINYEYIQLAIKEGEKYTDIKDLLKRKQIKYDKKLLKKASIVGKQNKNSENDRKFKRKIRHLLVREQFARIFLSNNIIKADSINALKLKLWLVKDSLAFNRHTLGIIYMELLQVMLFHQGWSYWNNSDFELLLVFVEKGYLNRRVTSEILDRKSINGVLFRVINGKILAKQVSKEVYNLSPFVSTGNRHFMINGKNVAMPVCSEMSEKELDELRLYLLYSSYSLFKKAHSNIFFPTQEEFRNM
jgi:hypothetical protein